MYSERVGVCLLTCHVISCHGMQALGGRISMRPMGATAVTRCSCTVTRTGCSGARKCLGQPRDMPCPPCSASRYGTHAVTDSGSCYIVAVCITVSGYCQLAAADYACCVRRKRNVYACRRHDGSLWDRSSPRSCCILGFLGL